MLLNTPLGPAIRAGAREIHIVYLDPDIRSIPLAAQENTLETLYRMQQIAWAAAVRADIDAALRINNVLSLIDETRKEHPEAPLLGPMTKKYAGYHPLTIHRYFPREDFGGALGLLNLQRSRIRELIERGFSDASSHDCGEAGCVLVEPLDAAAPRDEQGDTA